MHLLSSRHLRRLDPLLGWRLALLLGAVALLLGLGALAAYRLLWAIWGSCYSPACAYLPTSPGVGVAVVAGVYLLLAIVAVKQLRFGDARPEQVPAAHDPVRANRLPRALGQDRVLFNAVLVLVLLLAAVIRFDRVELAHFKADQANAAIMAAEIVTQGHLYLLGTIASIGVPHLPGHIYLFAPGTLFTRNPLGLSLFTGLFGLVTVYLSAVVGRRWLGVLAGLTAAFMLAAGPGAVECSRKVWAPCLLPPAVLLFLDATLLLALRQQPWALVNTAFWVGVITQLHILGPAYLLVLPIAAFFARARLRLRHVLTAVAAFVALLVPYLVWELTPHVRFRDVRHVLSQLGEERAAGFDLSPILYLIDLASHGHIASLFRPNEHVFRLNAEPWLSFTYSGAVLAALGLLWCLSSFAADASRRTLSLVLVASLLAPAAVLLLDSSSVYAHYLFGAFPLLALLGGIAAQATLRGARRFDLGPPLLRTGMGTAAVALVSGLVLLYAAGSMLTLDTAKRLAPRLQNDELGPPASHTWRAGQAAAQLWQETGSENPIFLGGHPNQVQPWVYTLGGDVAWTVQTFDNCKHLPAAPRPGPVVILSYDVWDPALVRLLIEGGEIMHRRPLPRLGGASFDLYVVDAAALIGEQVPEEQAVAFSMCLDRVFSSRQEYPH